MRALRRAGAGKASETMAEEHHEGKEIELAHAAPESCPRSSYAQSSAALQLEGAASLRLEESVGIC